MSRRDTQFNPNKIELFTYDEDSKKFKPLGGDNPIPVVVVNGELGGGNGGSRLNFLHGEGEPTQDIGGDGDVYLNVNNGDLSKKEDGNWNLLLNLKGKDGKDGVDGRNGVDGKDGSNGVDGKDGYTPIKNVDYFDGADGKDGVNGTNGADGKDGADGYTPVKGVDYFDGVDGKDGRDGVDGFVTEQMYNDIISRLEDLEGTESD